MFNKKTALSTLLFIGILFLGSLILKIVLVRKIILTLILIAVAILAIIWTIHALGNDDYDIIQRVVKFFLRGIIALSYIRGLILFFPIMWKW